MNGDEEELRRRLSTNLNLSPDSDYYTILRIYLGRRLSNTPPGMEFTVRDLSNAAIPGWCGTGRSENKRLRAHLNRTIHPLLVRHSLVERVMDEEGKQVTEGRFRVYRKLQDNAFK